jgi:hypothetical protein
MINSRKIIVVTCPKCQCDVFTLTDDRAWRCIKCRQLVKGPKNFHVLHKRGNPYSEPKPLISLVRAGAVYETECAKPAIA